MDFPRQPPSMLSRIRGPARRLLGDWSVVACVAAALLACAAVGAILVARPLATDEVGGHESPRYTGQGALLRPEGIEQWVFVGASIGLSYTDASRTDGPGTFHNVYITPSAFEVFSKTRTFPEGTMLAMTAYEAAEKVAPSRQGFFEGERLALEVTVKDSARFPGRWAYFVFGSDRTSAEPSGDRCNACHKQHAATDNVFTQFYPLLRDR